MLSAEQRAIFAARGLLRLPGLVDRAVVAALRERLAERLRGGLVPDPPPPGFVVHASATASLVKRTAFAEVWGAAAVELVDDLVGAGRYVPPGAGQILAVAFPTPGAAWRVPHKVWHLDYTAPGSLAGIAGVQLFLCLDRVAPRAGATVVACGTHRLIEALRQREGAGFPGRSQVVRKRLAAECPWLGALTSLREGEDRVARFVERAELCGGVELQVVELAGEPGDVLAMHPWLLHAPALNCGDRPRAVLTERVRSKEWMATLGNDGAATKEGV
ncbi:MAG TPA: phytanoyl-CoA dioxygenase family protein [Myxococcota bacterium]|nr:phytanoyl-CoA dioxygenase family protein [Myxococcota bacterium]